MKAVYMKEPWSIEVKDIEQRKPEKNEALLAIKAAGICVPSSPARASLSSAPSRAVCT